MEENLVDLVKKRYEGKAQEYVRESAVYMHIPTSTTKICGANKRVVRIK